ncbi:hypothetical protein SKAU_G00361490 [Synaphobranchus kaupii]|uniref:Uncharacterized protein n=1 Tax=Synaphobranchus kaupii TaxID=118154 RepID=A0A9Q1EIG8_SYNKA|nr:hypothetical protein SKAU_G00361490 [Synaphobranchus kaupii]
MSDLTVLILSEERAGADSCRSPKTHKRIPELELVLRYTLTRHLLGDPQWRLDLRKACSWWAARLEFEEVSNLWDCIAPPAMRSPGRTGQDP